MWLVGVVFPANVSATPSVQAASQVRELDKMEFENFIDGVIESRMATHNVVGVMVSLVKDGQLFFAKGYGMADKEQKVPVDAENTLFRAGSVGKVLTWIGLHQLAERGLVDLDADINLYLPPENRVAQNHAKPVTVKDLMLHTGGFEEVGLGQFVYKKAEDVPSLTDYLSRYPRQRIREPGLYFSYSNYGSALGGQIIASVTGVSYDDYIEKNILFPLGMFDTTAREPLGSEDPRNMPVDIAARVSKGYNHIGGDVFESSDFIYMAAIGPAGSLSSTATDMAKLAQVFLNRGELNGVRILEEESVDRMMTRLKDRPAKAQGITLGMFENWLLGHRRVGHDGGTPSFLTEFRLYPELDLGIFISTNTSSGSALNAGLEELILQRYFGDVSEVAAVEPASDFYERSGKFTGSYLNVRSAFSNSERLFYFFARTHGVEASPDGYLLVPQAGYTAKMVEVAPLLFREHDKENYMRFVEDESGEITHLLRSNSYRKLHWYQSPNFIFFTTLTLVVCSVVNIVRLRKSRAGQSGETKLEKYTRRFTWVYSLAWLLYILFLLATFFEGASLGDEILYEFPTPLMKTTLGFGVVMLIFGIASLATLFSVWKTDKDTLFGKVRHVSFLLIGFAMLHAINFLNLVGLNYYV